jgi:hypothetical protein
LSIFICSDSLATGVQSDQSPADSHTKDAAVL